MRRSAGAISGVWPIIAHPIFMTWARTSASDRAVRKPGIASSLSSVPPVWPRPRPDIIGTATGGVGGDQGGPFLGRQSAAVALALDERDHQHYRPAPVRSR